MQRYFAFILTAAVALTPLAARADKDDHHRDRDRDWHAQQRHDRDDHPASRWNRGAPYGYTPQTWNNGYPYANTVYRNGAYYPNGYRNAYGQRRDRDDRGQHRDRDDRHHRDRDDH